MYDIRAAGAEAPRGCCVKGNSQVGCNREAADGPQVDCRRALVCKLLEGIDLRLPRPLAFLIQSAQRSVSPLLRIDGREPRRTGRLGSRVGFTLLSQDCQFVAQLGLSSAN